MKKRLFAMIIIIALMSSMLSVSIFAKQESPNETTDRYSVLILDTSGSMQGTPRDKQKIAATKFCEELLSVSGNNKIAIVTLNSNSSVVCDFTDDLETLKSVILTLRASGGTNINDALNSADNLLSKIKDEAVKNIVLCSDGIPESGRTSTSGKYTAEDHPYSYQYGNAALATANEMKGSYKIYSLGFFHSLSGIDLTFGRQLMNDLQNAGFYEVNDPEDLEFQFGSIAQSITSNDVPIIVIPGIMGSQLYNEAGNRIWGTKSNALSFSIGDNLNINNDVTPGGEHSNLYLEPYEKDDREYGTLDTYKYLIDFLCDKYYTSTGNTIRDIYFFSYDWRQSNADSARKLFDELEKSKISSAVIIGHSMGGLVLSNFIKLYPQFDIQKTITLGTPYEGATRLLQAVLTDNTLDLKIANWWMALNGLSRSVKSEFKGVGALTPTEHTKSISYVSHSRDIDNQLIVTNQSQLGDLAFSSFTVFTPTQFEWTLKMHQGLRRNVEIEKWYSNLKEHYLKKGRTLVRLECAPSFNKTTIIPYYKESVDLDYSEMMEEIYGKKNARIIQQEQEVVQDAIQILLNRDNSYFAIGDCGPTMTGATLEVDKEKGNISFSEKDVRYGHGDGTVPLYSAKMLQEYVTANMAYFNLDHGALAGDKNPVGWVNVSDWLSAIIEGTDYSDPTYNENKTRHMVIRIACPVNVTVEYNNEVLSNSEDNYADTASFGCMDLIGEAGEIKMFCVDSDKKYKITIDGTDTGTMDYTIRYLDENYVQEEEYELLGIPVTDETVITTEVIDKEEPVLEIDNNGDGFIDKERKVNDLAFVIEEDDDEDESTSEQVVKPSDKPKAEEPVSDQKDDNKSEESPKQDILVFDDVPDGKWFSDAVKYCKDKGYMDGKINSKFDPNGTVTRATVAQVLYAMEGKPETEAITKNPFSDVESGKWYETAVKWAASVGIVAGYPDKTFKPDRAVTREELVTILYAYAKFNNDELKTSSDVLGKYADAGQIHKYAVNAMQWGVTNGIISGTKKGIEPRGTATRAQLAVILKAYDSNIRK